MDYWRNNTIWFDDVPDYLYADINLNNETVNKRELGSVKIEEIALGKIRYLTLWNYKKNNVGVLDNIPEDLIYLEMNKANIENFKSIENFRGLKRLELHYCTKLQSDSGISAFTDTLEHLHINQSKKFTPNEELFSLKNLRVLCLNACGDLQNLNFLEEFPHLIDFRFANTNVLDGDLNPILNHPTIRTAGFLNKKHYNIKSNDLNERLNSKNEGRPFEEVIKNKYNDETFRYIY
ncbi:hypothetical protein [Niallia sp. Man26]|uniref:hypothetical protein n=1 Tax=Niallia sp. Man26 TaxID=2912824 RepID=UPI001EDAFC69|nr:hypothetical protein [Niallia sp. Man26]UPO90166.1 hypothetical protein L8T27_025750 [Niallia sp. Man26]